LETSKPSTTYDCSVGGPLPENPSANYLVSVPAQGGEPRVKVYTSAGKKNAEFLAYAKSFRGGLSVAGGDINGDGLGEIVVGTGVGSGPQVSMFSRTGRSVTRFFPFSSRLRTGVNVAIGDVDGDGNADLITVPAGNYPPLVRIFRFDQKRKQFVRMADISAQGGRFRGGVNIEVGDLDRNGLSDIVVSPAARGLGSTVEVYEYNVTSGRFARVTSFSAYAKGFQSGITTAIGDVDGDGNNELITSPAPGATDVRVFSYRNHRAVKMGSFLAGATSFRGGVDLASLDVNRDGRDDIVTVSYSNGLPGIRVFTKSIASNKFSRITSPFPPFVYSTTFQKGVRLGAL
jgi:serralysin